MCTLSWHVSATGYSVYFNRDEQRSRPQAKPPFWHTHPNCTQYLAPIDPQGGGTWIGINENGLLLALLNFYAANAPQTKESALKSRGQLIPHWMGINHLKELEHFGEQTETQDYAPFLLFGLSPHNESILFAWDGDTLQRHRDPESPITTSSVRSEEVTRIRREYWEALSNTTSDQVLRHRQYHRWHDTADPAASVLIARSDALTVSHTEIRWERGHITMDYYSIVETPTGLMLQPEDSSDKDDT